MKWIKPYAYTHPLSLGPPSPPHPTQLDHHRTLSCQRSFKRLTNKGKFLLYSLLHLPFLVFSFLCTDLCFLWFPLPQTWRNSFNISFSADLLLINSQFLYILNGLFCLHYSPPPFFLLMWTIFTVSTEFVTIPLLFHALVPWVWGRWNPSSLTWDRPSCPVPTLEGEVSTTGLPGKSPLCPFKYFYFHKDKKKKGSTPNNDNINNILRKWEAICSSIM